MDIEKIRQDFPMLQGKTMQGKPLIYLDNGATTFKPKPVIDEIVAYLSDYTANAHRGDYDLSYVVDTKYEQVRADVAKLINAPNPKEIVFTYGATDSLNLIAEGYAKTHLGQGDEILICVAEHAANTLPWFKVAREVGAQVNYIDLDETGRVQMEAVKRAVNDHTKIIALAHVTNVLGHVLPVKEICAYAHERGIIVVIDGAQSVPHMPVDVQDLDMDFLVFSAHKMCGPTGVGVLYGKYDFLRFLSIFAAKEDDNGTLTLFVDEKNLPVAESLLIARYHYNLQVPYHRTRSGYDIVLKKFIETNVHETNIFDIDGDKIKNIEFAKFEITDDGNIFEQIKKGFVEGERWSEFLMRKKHLRPIIDTNNIAHGEKFFKRIIRALESEDKFIKDEDYFFQEQKVEMLKKVISPSAGELGKEEKQELPEGTIRLYSLNLESGRFEFFDIRDRSWIFGRLKEDPHFIFRLYVVPERYDAMKKFIADELSYGKKE